MHFQDKKKSCLGTAQKKTSQITEFSKAHLFVELDSTGHTAPTGQLAELVESVKHGAILAHVEPGQVFLREHTPSSITKCGSKLLKAVLQQWESNGTL